MHQVSTREIQEVKDIIRAECVRGLANLKDWEQTDATWTVARRIVDRLDQEVDVHYNLEKLDREQREGITGLDYRDRIDTWTIETAFNDRAQVEVIRSIVLRVMDAKGITRQVKKWFN